MKRACLELENFSDKLKFSSKIVKAINSHTRESRGFMALASFQGKDPLDDNFPVQGRPENKEAVFLGYDALNQLLFLMTDEKVHHLPQTCSSYGPQENPPLPTDLITYAASLLWHSKRLDPTGLILMGQRYYDPKGGRFISPDPISFPLCLNLYAYAGGDPINYFDPDGRFASNIYQTSKPTLLAGLDSLTGYRQKIKAFNRTSSFCLDHHLTCSEPYQVGLLDLPNGAINFNNGINNTKEASMKKAHQLSQLAGGAKIYGIYNATNGPIVDIIECGLGHFGCMTPPTLLLKARWNYFINMYGPKAKFFQPCHSGGADHVKNALLSSPKSTQQQIIVLAIAPSVIIPEEICFRSYNYIIARLV